jgi:hypothetical protein
MSDHKQKTVQHPEFGPINVDAKIAELLNYLWLLDIMTYNSCQENKKGIVWIQFASGMDAEEFLNCLFHKKDNCRGKILELYKRVCWHQDESWDFSVCYENINYEIKNDEIIETGDPTFNISISLRFPISDYKVVLKTIKEYWQFKN